MRKFIAVGAIALTSLGAVETVSAQAKDSGPVVSAAAPAKYGYAWPGYLERAFIRGCLRYELVRPNQCNALMRWTERRYSVHEFAHMTHAENRAWGRAYTQRFG